MPLQFRNTFRADLRDIRFVLWEQLRLDERLAALGTYDGFSPDVVDDFLDSAERFALQRLGPAYQAADREGCRVTDNNRVSVPKCYEPIWEAFVSEGWPRLGHSADAGGLGAPFVVSQAVNELLFGADPSFMIYSGFGVPIGKLIEAFGSQELVEMVCPKLARGEWTACLCMTEPHAGSDLGLARTTASRIDDSTFSVVGEKCFVSAGAHNLTENIVYLVLARPEGAPAGLRGLSLFLVPHCLMSDGGAPATNGVECARIEEKMGLHGSATAHLRFGQAGVTKGYLLGDKLNEGMVQLRSVMSYARVSTGVYALGLASSAHLNALEYANQRIQGTHPRHSINPRAARIPIIEHIDVRRMLLEMRSKVEGMRALIVRLAWYQTVVESAEMRGAQDQSVTQSSLVRALTPIAKAYVSDQAWRICELAIQVLGGAGYLKDHPLEQYARDVKVMSIWEGTNYFQAVDLLHGHLRAGEHSSPLDLLLEEIRPVRNALARSGFARESRVFEAGIAAVQQSLANLQEMARQKKLEEAHVHATRFLESYSEMVVAWLLLEAALVARRKTESGLTDVGEAAFYQRKLDSARYYVLNVLPAAGMRAQLTELAAESVPPLS